MVPDPSMGKSVEELVNCSFSQSCGVSSFLVLKTVQQVRHWLDAKHYILFLYKQADQSIHAVAIVYAADEYLLVKDSLNPLSYNVIPTKPPFVVRDPLNPTSLRFDIDAINPSMPQWACPFLITLAAQHPLTSSQFGEKVTA